MRLIQLARSLERRAAGRMQRRLLRRGCSPARRPPRLTTAWPPWGRSGAQAALRSSRVTRTFTQPTSGGCRRSSAPLAASCTRGAPATTRCAAGASPRGAPQPLLLWTVNRLGRGAAAGARRTRPPEQWPQSISCPPSPAMIAILASIISPEPERCSPNGCTLSGSCGECVPPRKMASQRHLKGYPGHVASTSGPSRQAKKRR